MMTTVIRKLEIALADTYAIYLKTQNYHWHVKGPQFKSLHELFEMQYQELAEAVDQVAERILIMGHKAPATFNEFNELKTIKDGNSSLSANQMVTELAQDHSVLVKDLNAAIKIAQEKNDEGTITLLSERISAHEKAHWMLAASMDLR
jgi:starvation-inducible DNA-binding protein